MNNKILITSLLINSWAFCAVESTEKPLINPDQNYNVHCRDGEITISGNLIIKSKLLSESLTLFFELKQPVGYINLTIFSSEIITLLNNINNDTELCKDIDDIDILTLLLNLVDYLNIDLEDNLSKALIKQFAKIFDTLSNEEKHVTFCKLNPETQSPIIQEYLETYHSQYLLSNNIITYKTSKILNHDGLVESIAISSDNTFIVTGSWDGKARIWDTQTGKLLKELDHCWPEVYNHNNNWVHLVSISPNNTFIITASRNNEVRVWDTQTGELVKKWDYTSYVDSIAISSNNKFIVTKLYDNTALTIWNIQTGSVKKLKGSDHFEWIIISSDNKFIIARSWDNAAKIWNAQTGKVIKILNNDESITSISIASDNKFIATALHGHHKVRISNMQTGEVKIFNYGDYVSSAAISSDNKFIVAGSSLNNKLKIWNFQTGKIIKILNNDNHLSSIAISSDNKFIITGSDDTKSKIWKLQWNISPIKAFDKLNKRKNWTPKIYMSIALSLILLSIIYKTNFIINEST